MRNRRVACWCLSPCIRVLPAVLTLSPGRVVANPQSTPSGTAPSYRAGARPQSIVHDAARSFEEGARFLSAGQLPEAVRAFSRADHLVQGSVPRYAYALAYAEWERGNYVRSLHFLARASRNQNDLLTDPFVKQHKSLDQLAEELGSKLARISVTVHLSPLRTPSHDEGEGPELWLNGSPLVVAPLVPRWLGAGADAVQQPVLLPSLHEGAGQEREPSPAGWTEAGTEPQGDQESAPGRPLLGLKRESDAVRVLILVDPNVPLRFTLNQPGCYPVEEEIRGGLSPGPAAPIELGYRDKPARLSIRFLDNKQRVLPGVLVSLDRRADPADTQLWKRIATPVSGRELRAGTYVIRGSLTGYRLPRPRELSLVAGQDEHVSLELIPDAPWYRRPWVWGIIGGAVGATAIALGVGFGTRTPQIDGGTLDTALGASFIR